MEFLKDFKLYAPVSELKIFLIHCKTKMIRMSGKQYLKTFFSHSSWKFDLNNLICDLIMEIKRKHTIQ